MSDWTYLLLTLPGFFAGLLVWSRISHLLQIFISTNTDSSSAEETSASSFRNQLLGVIAFIAGWLGLFGGLAFYFFEKQDGSWGWFWFFVGISVTPCVIVPPALFFWLRGRKRIAKYEADTGESPPSGTTIVYDISFDESYIRTLIDRYLRQLPMYPRPVSALISVNLIVVAVLIFVPTEDVRYIIATSVFIIGNLGFLVGPWWTKRMLFSDLGYAAHMGKSSTYTLTADGLEVSGPRPLHKIMWPDLIKWPQFWKATRFANGIFLFGGGALAWLPDEALMDASANDVARFIGEKMRLRTAK